MQTVGLVFLELEYRPPVEQPARQVHVTTGRRMHDRKAILLAHGVCLDHFLRFFSETLRLDLVRLVGEVLLSRAMPVDHHEEHEESPEERDDDPDEFDLGDRLLPPVSFKRRCYSHGSAPCLVCYRNLGNLHDSPDDVEDGRYRDAKE